MVEKKQEDADDDDTLAGDLICAWHALFGNNEWEQQASIPHTHTTSRMVAIPSCTILDLLEDGHLLTMQISKLQQLKPRLHVAWFTFATNGDTGINSNPGFETY